MSKLTKVNVFKVPNKDDFGTRALVELIFNDDIKLAGLHLIETKEGDWRLRFPINPKSKRHMAYSFVLDEGLRKSVLEDVLAEYDKAEG